MQEILSRSKILSYQDRLREWKVSGRAKPITAEVDPTNSCNLNCPKCAGNRSERNAKLDFFEMKKIIDETSSFLKGIVFTGGGEPLLNPDASKAIAYAKKSNLDVGLATNGALLDEIDNKRLILDCTWIRISIDAANPQDYYILKGGDEKNYLQVWKNVEELVDLRNDLRSKCIIGVACLTNGDEKDKLLNFAGKAKIIGADYAQFRPFHHSNENLAPYISHIQTILNSDTFSVIATEDKYLRRKYAYKQAFADNFRTVFGADGLVYPCCFTRGMDEFSIGNALNDSFETIWKSDKKADIFERKLTIDSCPVQCYQDPLNQLLWNLHKMSETGFEQFISNPRQGIVHGSFI